MWDTGDEDAGASVHGEALAFTRRAAHPPDLDIASGDEATAARATVANARRRALRYIIPVLIVLPLVVVAGVLVAKGTAAQVLGGRGRGTLAQDGRPVGEPQWPDSDAVTNPSASGSPSASASPAGATAPNARPSATRGAANAGPTRPSTESKTPNAPASPGTTPDGAVALKQLYSGLCLDVAGGANANGTPVQLWDCLGSWGQQWTVTTAGEMRVTIDGVTKCMDANADGTSIVIWDCHGGINQKWTLTSDGHIIGQQLNKCVEAYGGNGTHVFLWPCIETATDERFIAYQ